MLRPKFNPTHLVFWISTISTFVSASTNFASNLASCTKQQELDACLRKTLEELRRLMPVGIPELGLNSSEPLHIENLHFLRKLEPIVVDSVLSQVVVTGLSEFQTRSISVDAKSQTLSLEIYVPKISIFGNYNIQGKIFVFPISGRGPFKSRLGGVTGSGGAEIVVVENALNRKILSIQNTSIDFDINSIFVNMENLFGGAEQLFAETVNKFLNENSDVILREIKPQIKGKMITIIERVLNDAFSQLPADDLIDNIHSRISS
ncbi:circadian clock-controlled protein daywake [Lepeophtheirus salmonis]|uniref:Circadian clock-controlled protein n=1 Tax=Lepeophtheirus salmonis TaxID=72036 RepID=C1BT29_LEPSM|nr:protein takeout-like [Lepeophtheirus salmonis]XP_040579459.1 protein takeout-like [Lepeophtheirus salmonis]ACO12182.1 Circadian clock-controlled protein precursor [Lepeophtheirus salmonis]ADD24110.1 Circadian clock-controlled protein precursor [Lepeophtheirus salmonis]